ncbi:MAG: tRNA lysidine(34) synthetase TilS [Candidatus Omnitrophota bacterium]|nr:tRNA lysidine(34) synthetase TilS [Candidatus Omnitrophota bacterium]
MTLPEKVRKFIKQYQLINARDKILIGLSGGPDSVCLLYALNALKEEFSLKLYIGHLNHSLRGRESDQDQEFVKKLSEKLKIPAFFKKVDVSRAAKTCCSEESARKIRFDFLFQTAKENHLTKIALGHNQDDQAETVLMRLIRGSGLLGLAAILPKRKIGGFTIIRPLLGIKRKDIESFLRLKKITSRVDSSNLREIYFRNRLRRTLLPELEKYNPNIKEVLAGTAQTAAYDYDFLYTSALKAFNKIKIIKLKQLKLPLEKFLSLHPALQNIILRLSFEELKGDTRRLTYQHIRELRDLMYCRPQGSVVDLPSHISTRKNQEFLDIYLRVTDQ